MQSWNAIPAIIHMHQSLGETGEVDEIDITPTHMIVSIPNDQWV
jgi:hypothetical protein